MARPTPCGPRARRSAEPFYYGVPSDEHVQTLLPLLDIDWHPHMRPPIDVLTDARHVLGLEDAAFRRLVGYVRRRLPDFARSLRRHAIVHPATDGLTGIAIAGLYRTLGPTFSTHHFVRLDDAFRWLGHPADGALALDVEKLTSVALDPVSRLRALLGRRPGTTLLSDAAELLGVSERSLQRALQLAGSSFRKEIDRARVEQAAELLVSTSDKLETIAERMGIDASSLARVFRRLTGESPSTFRARKRIGEGSLA